MPHTLAITVGILLLCTLVPTTIPAQSSPQGCEDLLKLSSDMGRAVDSVFVNKEVCDAYRFLLERNGTGTKGTQCYRSQTDRILKLNPHFALGLAKALAEMERLFGGKNIVQSGFRCDGSNGNHPKGCAADIIWASCLAKTGGNTEAAWRCSSDSFNAPEQKWIDANGKNEQYKIHLRLRYAPEGHHVEPVSIRGCVTGATVGSAPPSSGISDIVRRAFSMPTQQTQPSVSQPAIPSQPVSTSQNPLDSFNPQLTPATPLSVPTTTTATTSNAAADRLEELAFGGQSTTSTATATSVPLVVSGSDAVVLTGTQQASTTSVTTQGLSSPSQTTFTSGDLAWQDQTVSSNPVSGVQAIIITIRAALNRISQYLVPFGARSHEHASEYDY